MLFDQLVGACEQRDVSVEDERFGNLQINGKLVDHKLDRQIAGLRTTARKRDQAVSGPQSVLTLAV
jgi:hypothetical protein